MSEPSAAYTVDIDIGGTLTDGLVTDGRRVWPVKVDTTPHDLTVCFFECLREGARRVGFDDLTAFLERVSVIRWSTTIATNVLAERKGPRIGLIVSAGHEHDLYGSESSPAVGHVVQPENVAAVGNPESDEEILAAVRVLLQQGVRRICVSLKGSFESNAAERRIKALVDEHFPDHYLGAVPTVLGSEIVRHPDDQTRTHMALINAYVHTPLAVALFKAEDELLSQHRYRRPVYIAHVNQGVARVAKTKAIDTTESGPVFGLLASSYFARRYGLDRVLSIDVGGTTAKIGVIVDGEPVTAREGEFLGIPVRMPWILLRSAPLGGGSVAGVRDDRVTLGPESMGAYPGPASYDLGGTSATLTDAFLVAGMLDPDRFLEGRRRLSVERAREAIARDVAAPLAADVVQAARAIIETGAGIVEDTARRALAAVGLGLEGFSLFAFGGNGGNFAVLVAQRLGLHTAYVFQLGPVLSAFGSSIAAIRHVHEEWLYLPLAGEDGLAERLQALVEAARERVLRDLKGEGISLAEAELTVEMTVGDGGRSRTVEAKPAEVAAALAGLRRSGSVLERVAVRGAYTVPRFEPEPSALERYEPQRQGERHLLGTQAAIYDWEQLKPGALVRGPAVLESGTNTCTVPDGWALEVDGLLNGVLRCEEGS